MKNQADYSKYLCPFHHVEKECGHHLYGPEGFQDCHEVWCLCGFRGPAFVLDPEALGLELKVSSLEPKLIEPMVVWLHVMDSTEGIQENAPSLRITYSPESPFGMPGRDYSAEYPVFKIMLGSLDDISGQAKEKAAFKMGFMASREGFNGECCYDHCSRSDPDWDDDIESTALDELQAKAMETLK